MACVRGCQRAKGRALTTVSPRQDQASGAADPAGDTSLAAATVAAREKVPLGGAPGLPLQPFAGAAEHALDWLAVPAGAHPRVRLEIARLNDEALAKVSEKDFNAAVEVLRRVLNLTPDAPAAHGNLGVALWQAKRAAEAEIHCRRAIALNRDYVPACMVLADILQQRRAFPEALACYNHVASLQPDNAIAHNNAGLILRKLGEFAQAETAFARAADLLPDDPRVRFNQLMMRRDDESLPGAIECCRRSLEQHPDSADVLTNLAVGLQLSGKFDEAFEVYEKALTIEPNQHDAHFNLGLLLLLRGEYERGWREYEHRWDLGDVTRPDFKQPLWEGERLDGKTILLHSEQGFGDAIQFFRYVPAVAQFGGRIVLRIERALVRLAASLPGTIVIKPGDARLPDFDVWCPLMSLPRLLGSDAELMPLTLPYLAPRAGIAERWRGTLAALPGVKIGLAWAGNPKHVNDLRRSISLERLRPLLEVPGVGWASLQVGPHSADIASLPEATIVDLSAQLTDFAETAGAIANLDLVVTVDTVVAHVAGAVGKPAWVMLPFSPDWRWMLDRADSPWYPSLRLYRQTAPSDWDGVIARVATDLAALVTARAAR
jgi:Flp pilus assembly protein TadD